MDLASGKFLVKLARKTIELWVIKREEIKPKDYPNQLEEKRGVFTTLYLYPSKELRGCIGYPEPTLPLIQALIKSAIATTQDPRFPDLRQGELNKITIEVSVLTKPELITVSNPKEYLKKIEVGKDGLIIEKGWNAGLFLPQVWEQLPTKEGFLDNLCLKAGLPIGIWRYDNSVKIYKFRVQTFEETKPGHS